MRLLNVKATLITTLSAIFIVSSVFADVGDQKKVKQGKAISKYDRPLLDTG